MKILISSIPSDSHTWNLVYMQMLVHELGHEVINLGQCMPIDELIKSAHYYRPDLILISTVNGHGHIEGMEIIKQVKCHDLLRNIKVVIGGKIGTKGEENIIYENKLKEAGYDEVFCGVNSVAEFLEFIGIVKRYLTGNLS